MGGSNYMSAVLKKKGAKVSKISKMKIPYVPSHQRLNAQISIIALTLVKSWIRNEKKAVGNIVTIMAENTSFLNH